MFDILKKLPKGNISRMIKDIENKGVTDRRVLSAMENIPRHIFVPFEMKMRSYDDTALPIGHRQTISQPYIVAYMTASLGLTQNDNVLEIGTGCGYQTAILAGLCKQVYSIEIDKRLSEAAFQNLEKLGIKNANLFIGDGFSGYWQKAPYDAIIVTASPTHIPPCLIEQLAQGGRMIIPVGPNSQEQEDEANYQWLFLVHKKDGQLEQERLIPVRFVPMVHEAFN